MGERPPWVGETPVGGRGPRGWARPLVGGRCWSCRWSEGVAGRGGAWAGAQRGGSEGAPRQMEFWGARMSLCRSVNSCGKAGN